MDSLAIDVTCYKNDKTGELMYIIYVYSHNSKEFSEKKVFNNKEKVIKYIHGLKPFFKEQESLFLADTEKNINFLSEIFKSKF